jgi:AraC family transcriptional regulator
MAIKPTRSVTLEAMRTLWVLTATARGMVGGNFMQAAHQAYGELMDAVGRAGLLSQVRSRVALSPDEPQGPNDPDCRYVAGVLFGHDLLRDQGPCLQPDLPLSGSLAWAQISPGRYVVFTHIGPYDSLHRSWNAIYRDWLPFSGEHPRESPSLELCVNTPETAPPDKLHTEIWVPVHGR